MSRSNWIKQPESARETCHCKVLPLTLKGLQSVVSKYSQNSKVNWHRVQFEYLSIVARALQIEPVLVLTDNTAIFDHDCSKDNLLKQIFLKSVYYRFIFELNPYSSQSLHLSKVEVVTPKEVTAHMMEVVSEEMFATAHEKILQLKENTKDLGQDRDLSVVRAAVRGLSTFDFNDVKSKTGLPDKNIENVLDKMCENSQIGNLGSHYMVANIPEENEEPESGRNEE